MLFRSPTRMLRFELIRDSAGPGHHRGGLGIRREYVNLAPARFSIRSTKHVIPPSGIEGGESGRAGRVVAYAGTGRQRELPTRYGDLPLRRGDRVVLETPGGGGCGPASRRDPLAVVEDLRDGYVTEPAARERYGLRDGGRTQ